MWVMAPIVAISLQQTFGGSSSFSEKFVEEPNSAAHAIPVSADKARKEAGNYGAFLQGFEAKDFLAPLKKAAEEAKSFAREIRDHGRVRGSDDDGAYAKAKEFVLKPKNSPSNPPKTTR